MTDQGEISYALGISIKSATERNDKFISDNQTTSTLYLNDLT